MKTIEEIEIEVINELGIIDYTNDYVREVAKRYALEAVKSDRERVKRAIRYPLGFIDGKIANEERIDNLPIELK